jgi:hypothetical protein
VYLALASGTTMPDTFTVDAPIGPVPFKKQTIIRGQNYLRGFDEEAMVSCVWPVPGMGS